MFSETENLAFVRYTDDDTEQALELPVEVRTRMAGRYEPEVRVLGDYDAAWDPATEQWVELTEAEQHEASELIADFERDQQATAEAQAEDAYDMAGEA